MIQLLDDKAVEKNTLDELKKNSSSSKKWSIASILVSFTAVICAGFSVYYADKDDKADTIWQKQQIGELININRNLTVQNELLKNILKNQVLEKRLHLKNKITNNTY